MDFGPEHHKGGAAAGSSQQPPAVTGGVYRNDSAERYAHTSGGVPVGNSAKQQQLAHGVAGSSGALTEPLQPQAGGAAADAAQQPLSPYEALLSQFAQPPLEPQLSYQAWHQAVPAGHDLSMQPASCAAAYGAADVRGSVDKRDQRRYVTDSAGPEEVRQQRVSTLVDELTAEAAVALRASTDVSPMMAAAQEVREARNVAASAEYERYAASRVSESASSVASLEDTFCELPHADSGRAMHRLSQQFSRRLSIANGRNSAGAAIAVILRPRTPPRFDPAAA